MIRLGYLKEKNEYDLDDELLTSLSHINIAFGKVIDTDGTVQFDVANEDKLLKFRKENPKIKMSLAIGGWSAGNFSEAASSIKSRARFSETAISIIKKYGFDGIDVDWEYPAIDSAGITASPNDTQNFTLLMSKLRRDLDVLGTADDKHYILSFAAGASLECMRKLELNKLYDVTDFMNLMTYDMGGSFGVAGHHASLYPSKLCKKKGGAYFVEAYHKAGYNKSKIVIGAAFYGRGGTGTDGINTPYYGKQGLYFDYHDVLDLIDNEKTKLYIDEEAKAAYTYDGDTFITIETTESIEAKIDYVIENKLAGIMFWEYATDNTGILLDIIVNYRC